MKKIFFIGLISLICLIGLIGCTSKQNAPDPFARPVYDPDAVLQNTHFQAVADASLITVTLKADKTIPVKGTLNIQKGSLDLASQKSNGLTEMNLIIDETSWDSGLTERDDLVKTLFFSQSGPGMRVSFASTDPKLIETLRAQKKLTSFETLVTLTWGDVPLTLHPTLSLTLTAQGYLSVKTIQPVPLKISELKRQSQLAQLIEVAMATRQEMRIEDAIFVDVDLQFAPVMP